MMRDQLEKKQKELQILELKTNIDELSNIIPVLKDLNKKYGKNIHFKKVVFKTIEPLENKLKELNSQLKDLDE